MGGQVGPGSINSSSSISVSMQTPTGAVNGINTDFTFTSPPLQVFFQGVLQNGSDYTLTGNTVTFIVAPVSGSVTGLIAS